MEAVLDLRSVLPHADEGLLNELLGLGHPPRQPQREPEDAALQLPIEIFERLTLPILRSAQQ